jgi:PEP-CTERM motif
MPFFRVVTGSLNIPAGAFKHMGFVMKNMRKMTLRAGLAAMALGMAGSAQAAQYLTTYQGIVGNHRESSGPAIDELGLFGSPNSVLTGRAFTVVYTLDDAVPEPNDINDGFNHFRSGIVSPGNPFYSATITINGIDFLFADNSPLFGQAALTKFGAYSSVSSQLYSNSTGAGIVLNLTSNTGNFLSSLNFGDPYSYTFRPGDSGRGLLQTAAPGVGRFNNGFRYTIAELNVTSISGGPVQVNLGAVPEPASWALMIAGFGLVGSAMRRRATKVAYA